MEWVSVKDKLPPENKIVLISWGYLRSTSIGSYWAMYWWSIEGNILGDAPAYWMSLPEPPKE